MEPVIVSAGERSPLSGPLGEDNAITILVRGGDSDGTLTALEVTVPPGDGPPLHVHTDADEGVYVLEGHIRWRLGDDVHPTTPGAFALVPRGLPHCFQNDGDRVARMLIWFTPAGMEGFFEQLAALPGRPDPAAFRAAAEAHRMQVVGPPLAESHPL